MGRGSNQVLYGAAAATLAVGRRTRSEAKPRDWAALASSSPQQFAIEVARVHGSELLEALKASTPIDRGTHLRWFDRYDLVRLHRPRSFDWAPIVITMTAFDRVGDSDNLRRRYGGGYRLATEELLSWVRALEAGQQITLPPIKPFPSNIGFVAA